LRCGGCDTFGGNEAAAAPAEAVGESLAAMTQPSRLGPDDELGIDRLELQAAMGPCGLDHPLELRSPDDDDIGAAPVRGIRLDPGVTERDIGGLGDDVIAPVAGRVLEKACAPVTVGEVPPILLGRRTVGKLEAGAVPIGRAG